MIKTIQAAALGILVVMLNACGPPEPVPAPYFIPNPPYPPQPVDPATVELQRPSPSADTGIVPSPAPSPRIGEYPLARPTSKLNEVISPYEPYHTIDISGFSSGQLARDPSNNRIFRVP
jgi:hypothetical protein